MDNKATNAGGPPLCFSDALGPAWLRFALNRLRTSPVNIDEPITIEPYNPAWAAQFARERDLLCQALSVGPSRVEHIGSTSIAGMHAKPIVDIMLGLDSF